MAVPDIQLADAKAIDDFFKNHKGQPFVRWFNSTLAGQGQWQGVKLVDTPQNDLGFHQFWNQLAHVFGGPIGLPQFVCLMSILANEVRGDYSPRTEGMGAAGHKGMAYLFDRIPGVKKSYNTLAGNRTALQCFQNEIYIGVHGGLPLASQLARTTDARWSGETWPAEIGTDPNPAISGFVTQADFMKFRGRGFIQTTGRPNYHKLIEFVQRVDSANSTMALYRQKWAGRDPDEVCYESTNADWDTLFQHTDLIIATEAVRLHSEACGHYLRVGPHPACLEGTGIGSAFYMGKSISGSDAYAAKFRDRISATLAAI